MLREWVNAVIYKYVSVCESHDVFPSEEERTDFDLLCLAVFLSLPDDVIGPITDTEPIDIFQIIAGSVGSILKQKHVSKDRNGSGKYRVDGYWYTELVNQIPDFYLQALYMRSYKIQDSDGDVFDRYIFKISVIGKACSVREKELGNKLFFAGKIFKRLKKNMDMETGSADDLFSVYRKMVSGYPVLTENEDFMERSDREAYWRLGCRVLCLPMGGMDK